MQDQSLAPDNSKVASVRPGTSSRHGCRPLRRASDMTDDRFARADQLTEHAFAAAFDHQMDVPTTVSDLSEMAVGDRPAIAIARARLAAHMAHRSTAAMARLAVSMLDS